ncbi:uncharacterized protein CC84DRAFT_1182168 [Paraphaeosphaeria sporulosa]|uniref:Uncharacterized protein n=1 Tax=Paraphaeosphaeria sporulosa TaxID=1460663 RepID=A0A177BSY0_9PLEO|nr:uncharacterized protein CC84DRAFT_1182168 [Paraphaeosphaeria sporulosa]OAF98483.1 hypothetical protein CC84DRAFT_1182168 [Paraphaeosphaeria sporulosa]
MGSYQTKRVREDLMKLAFGPIARRNDNLSQSLHSMSLSRDVGAPVAVGAEDLGFKKRHDMLGLRVDLEKARQRGKKEIRLIKAQIKNLIKTLSHLKLQEKMVAYFEHRAWIDTMRPQLILSAFEATGIWPLNPQRILDRFHQSTPSCRDTPNSDTSALSASDWRKINQLLKAVVGVGGDSQAKKLSQTVHHITIQKQLLDEENKHLREALLTKKRRSKKGRPLPLDQSYGGAIFWSPSKVQRARDLEHQLDQVEKQKERQQADQIEARRANQLLNARLAEERRVARVADREARRRQRADAAIQRRLINRPAGPNNNTNDRSR